jgi:hypothetical protein
MSISKLHEAARWYAKHSLPVGPLWPRTKRPLTQHGVKDACTDLQQIERWWTEHPDANIAIPMGSPSRLLLLDLDYRGQSVVSERSDLIRLFGPIPETAEVITGSGGLHIYFRFAGGKVPKQIARGVELKADGGYSVAPPSIHPNGKEYAFDGAENAKALLHVADPPTWLLAAITGTGASSKNVAAADEQWHEGERNNRLCSLAGKLRRSGLSVGAITAALLEENRMRCVPPLPEAEVRGVAQSVGRYAPAPASPFVAAVSLDHIEPTLEMLNACAILVGRIQFRAVKRRGPMLIASTVEGVEVIWPTVADLASFHTSRAIIAEATNVFLPTPPQRAIRAQWEPAARILLRLAAADGIMVESALREETRDLLRLMWRQSGQKSAEGGADFIAFIREIQSSRRDPRGQAPPSVFIAEELCWVHVPTLRLWLSTPSFTNKLYPLADIRNGLLLLGFVYCENLTRRWESDSETACLWRGPMEVLSDTDSPDSPFTDSPDSPFTP